MDKHFLAATILLVLCFDMVHAQGYVVSDQNDTASCDGNNLSSNCGYPEITEEQCDDLGCCFDEELPNDCFYPHGVTDRCSSISDRKDCGFDGITEKECVASRGCCYHEDEDDNVPHCFFANECFNDEATHFQCGPDDVTNDACVNRLGCCYSVETDKCYFSFNDDKKCYLEHEDRVDCGFKGISRKTCVERRGCCFDDSVGDAAPHCYKPTSRECECTECGQRLDKSGRRTCTDDSPADPRVKIAKDRQFPFLAQIEQSQGSSEFCAGAIIDCTHILTAMSCVGSHSTADVRVGSNVWGEGTLSRKAKVSVHPKSNIHHTNGPYNIAILKLEHALEWSDSVQPICLSDEGFDFEDERKLTEAGWQFKFEDRTTVQGNCLRSKKVGKKFEDLLDLIVTGDRTFDDMPKMKGFEGNPLFSKENDGKYTLWGLSTDDTVETYGAESFINVERVIEEWTEVNDLVETINDQEEECEESTESSSGD